MATRETIVIEVEENVQRMLQAIAATKGISLQEYCQRTIEEELKRDLNRDLCCHRPVTTGTQKGSFCMRRVTTLYGCFDHSGPTVCSDRPWLSCQAHSLDNPDYFSYIARQQRDNTELWRQYQEQLRQRGELDRYLQKRKPWLPI